MILPGTSTVTCKSEIQIFFFFNFFQLPVFTRNTLNKICCLFCFGSYKFSFNLFEKPPFSAGMGF